MNRIVFAATVALGLFTVGWVAWGFVDTSWLFLAMPAAIAVVFALGALEVKRFDTTTTELAAALADVPPSLSDTGAWLERLPPALRNLVRLRIEGERVPLPGLTLTPYLVGLLVMLGMLGTFVGMVVTFKGAVFALEGSADLQAIRSALSAPIQGLGVAFGTSVAGVATSALLGLLSALARRRRLQASRQLDTLAATVFRPLSLSHHRQEAFKALQVQAHALPEVVDRLQFMMDRIESRSEQLNAQLVGQQDRFHQGVTGVYTDLARTVGVSLTESLAAGAKSAGDSIRPVVESAMSELAAESTRLHRRVFEATQTQLEILTRDLGATARSAGDGWAAALQQHARSQEDQLERVGHMLAGITQTFEHRSAALVTAVQAAAADSQVKQAAEDHARMARWTAALEGTAENLQSEWQRVGSETMAEQRAATLTLAQTAAEINERASQQAAAMLQEVAGLLTRSEALVQSRVVAEEQWVGQQGERMDQLAALWKSELGALRADEAGRGHAAVERLGELQSALASHLATLGTALEAPMTRLMQTAAEVPQAAAQVISQLREEMTRLSERDNQAFEERSGLLADISTLLLSLNTASGQQQAAIESLVASAKTVLEQASTQFSATLTEQAGRSADVSTHVAASAIELGSLGESFGHGVELFSTTNEKLIDSLQRMESVIGRQIARSDEQLAYYVAQAREVIDLSMSSQQALVEDLRRQGGRKAAHADEADEADKATA